VKSNASSVQPSQACPPGQPLVLGRLFPPGNRLRTPDAGRHCLLTSRNTSPERAFAARMPRHGHERTACRGKHALVPTHGTTRQGQTKRAWAGYASKHLADRPHCVSGQLRWPAPHLPVCVSRWRPIAKNPGAMRQARSTQGLHCRGEAGVMGTLAGRAHFATPRRRPPGRGGNRTSRRCRWSSHIRTRQRRTCHGRGATPSAGERGDHRRLSPSRNNPGRSPEDAACA